MLADAEKALVAGGVPADAFDMHMRAGRFQDALRLCERYHLSGMQQALTARVRCTSAQCSLGRLSLPLRAALARSAA